MNVPEEVAPGIRLIDSRMGGVDGVTSAYLIEAPEPALIETGPTTSLEPIGSALAEIGLGVHDLAHIFVTHIHIDHAGGAGAFAERFPRATVWVHERGAPHLADPAKLEASATRTFGEDHMRRVFGPMVPVAAVRIQALADGDVVELGGRRIEALHSPGHAPHHAYYMDSASGALFSGDALGVSLPGAGILRPATPPPDFDLELAVQSMQLVIRRRPEVVLLSHFGPVREVIPFCTEAIERLGWWAGAVEAAMRLSDDPDVITERLREAIQAEEAARGTPRDLLDLYDLLLTPQINALGMIRHLQKKREREATVDREGSAP